ncbi:hypothetical protein GLA29479_4724 [Lysobacter antibioticus]|nr:hypothetical protein GLA29479_4724 [Lysobacter antibioticus]
MATAVLTRAILAFRVAAPTSADTAQQTGSDKPIRRRNMVRSMEAG